MSGMLFPTGMGRSTPRSRHDSKAGKMRGPAAAAIPWMAQKRAFTEMFFAASKEGFCEIRHWTPESHDVFLESQSLM